MIDAAFTELRTEMLAAARHLLEKRGEFMPFWMVRTSEGDIAPFIVQGDERDPDAATLMAWHGEELAKLAADGTISQSAMGADVRMRDPATGAPVDAVMLTFRSHDAAQDEAIPYTIETSGMVFKKRAVTFGDGQVSEPARNEIFD